MPAILAYHVSSVADLDVVERRVCGNEDRDGLLYGAKVASFTTTLFKGRLPDFSPYPCAEEGGFLGYRYTMHFNPDKYYKFKMADSDSQVRYLLLNKSIPKENKLAQRVREELPNSEDKDWGRFFPNEEANDYSYLRWYESQYAGAVFVNVMFWHDVPVRKPADVDDYQVVKEGPTFPREQIQALRTNEWLASLRRPADDDVDDLAGILGRTGLNEN